MVLFVKILTNATEKYIIAVKCATTTSATIHAHVCLDTNL